MHRLLVISVSFLALAGCAAPEHTDTSASAAAPAATVQAATAQAAAPVLDARFTGTWYVSGVFPSASQRASIADPHLGGSLVIGETEVSDVNGQRCISPAFAMDKVAAEKAGAKLGGDASWDRLSVTCEGRAFATYLRLPDRTGDGPALLQQRPEGLYLLEQAAALQHRRPSETVAAPRTAGMMPAPEAPKVEQQAAMAAPAEPAPEKHDTNKKAEVKKTEVKKAETKKAEATKTAPAPMTEGPVEASAAEPAAKSSAKAANGKLPAAGSAMHLASYKGESAAKRGWKILLGEYDELDPLSPLYVSVDVPGKGEMIRLYATGAEPAEIAKICAALKAKKVYCALNP